MLRCSIEQAAAPGALTMLIFAARRIIQAIPILLGVSLVVFGLVHIVPGNPIDMLMPPEASPEVIAQMKAAFGFDKPLYMQYLLWLGRALRGDFGLSVFNATPVWGQLVAALGNTFILAILAAMLGFSLGIGCGLLAAAFHGRWPDKLFSAIATTGVSLPHYWCAIVLVLCLSPCCMTGCRRRAWATTRCRCTTGWNTSSCR